MSPTNTSKEAKVDFFDQAYEILAPVGRGRHSIVYKAKGPSESQEIALKVLIGKAKAPEVVVQRMRREALAMLSCVHPNIIRLIDYVTDGEFCYLAMEFAEQGDLRELMTLRGKPFDPRLVLDIVEQTLRGLSRIHSAGILHRDIKPDNLLLTKDYTVKIADFGVALLPNEELRLESQGSGVGTFDYLAPELLEDGKSSEAADVYSLAVTCYELLTGRLPFQGGSFTEQVQAKMSGVIEPLPAAVEQAQPGLEKFLTLALRPKVNDRFKNANEFLEALLKFRSGEWKSSSRKPQATLAVVTSIAQPVAIENIPDRNIPDRNIPEPLVIDRQVVAAQEAATPSLPVAALGAVLLLILAPITMFLIITGHRDVGSAMSVQELSSNLELKEELPTLTVQEPRGALNQRASKRTFGALLDGTYVGSIEGLLPDGQSFSLVATPAEGAQGEQAVLLAVGLSGWTPLVVTESELRNTSELTLASGGIRIALRVESEDGSAQGGYVLRGTFTEHLTGRSGDWVIW